MRPILKRMIVPVMGGGLTYPQKMLALHPIQYLKLDEAAGTAAVDSSGNSRNGAYVNGTKNQAAFVPNSKASVYLDGTGDAINLYSVSLRDAFKGAEGSLVINAKADAAIWTDGVLRCFGFLFVDGSNYLTIRSRADVSANRIGFSYVAGGTGLHINMDGAAETERMTLVLTWSKSSNRIRAYYQGEMVEQKTGLGTWVGSLGAANTVLGASDSSGAAGMKGYFSDCAIFDYELTGAEVASVSNSIAPPVFFGDSWTNGEGATSTLKNYRYLTSVGMGWSRPINAGINGTVLQNTVQNTVATVGGAVTNNGRDTCSARVLAYNPAQVIIFYGLNDLRLNDAAFTAENFENDLGEIVDALTAGGVAAANICIGSPGYIPAASYALYSPYDGGSAEKHAAYVAACAAVAAAKGTKYIDVYAWMVANGGDALIGGDGVHPNDAGHQAIANAFLSVL